MTAAELGLARRLAPHAGLAVGKGVLEAVVAWCRAHIRERREAVKIAVTLAGIGLAEALRRWLFRWYSWQRWRASRRCLELKSPLEASGTKLALPRWGGTELSWLWPFKQLPDIWRGHCPCCKRPLEIRRWTKWAPSRPRWQARGQCAFVINLWGASPAYVLGALVLGHSIRKTNTRHSLVCLHTADVPDAFLELLRRIWDCREVQHLEVATQSLSVEDQCERFEKVFTKLRGMQLTDFEKILVMDIDLLVRSNIDELFELQAPAAMRRGMTTQYKTGDAMDGTRFFLGKQDSRWSWSIGTGINAGVMLWQPSEQVFQEMVSELEEVNHPSHMKGNGPEQDYLSRFWADAPWSHIGVQYNFQLHQMYFALHPDSVHRAERVKLLQTPEEIKIVHYSGVEAAKPWHRILDSKWTKFWPDRARDKEYAEEYAKEFMGHWLWVLRDPQYFDRDKQGGSDIKGMFLDDIGQIWREAYWDQDGSEPPELLDIPEAASQGASDFLSSVLREWFDTLEDLEKELGMDLRQEMQRATAQAKAAAEALAAAAMAPPPEVGAFEDHDRLGANGVVERRDGHGAGAGRVGGDRLAAGAAQSTRPGSSSYRGRLSWECPPSGWWVERKKGDGVWMALPGKSSVLCCATAARRFVLFVEGAEEVHYEEPAGSSPRSPASGAVFLKVVGDAEARRFEVPTAEDADPADVEEAVGPIRCHAEAVPQGSEVLLAILDASPAALRGVLAALAPLGVPTAPPPPGVRALAAAGIAQAPPERGSGDVNGFRAPAPFGQRKPPDGCWFSNHAAVDVAYAAMPRAS